MVHKLRSVDDILGAKRAQAKSGVLNHGESIPKQTLDEIPMKSKQMADCRFQSVQNLTKMIFNMEDPL